MSIYNLEVYGRFDGDMEALEAVLFSLAGNELAENQVRVKSLIPQVTDLTEAWGIEKPKPHAITHGYVVLGEFPQVVAYAQANHKDLFLVTYED